MMAARGGSRRQRIVDKKARLAAMQEVALTDSQERERLPVDRSATDDPRRTFARRRSHSANSLLSSMGSSESLPNSPSRLTESASTKSTKEPS